MGTHPAGSRGSERLQAREAGSRSRPDASCSSAGRTLSPAIVLPPSFPDGASGPHPAASNDSAPDRGQGRFYSGSSCPRRGGEGEGEERREKNGKGRPPLPPTPSAEGGHSVHRHGPRVLSDTHGRWAPCWALNTVEETGGVCAQGSSQPTWGERSQAICQDGMLSNRRTETGLGSPPRHPSCQSQAPSGVSPRLPTPAPRRSPRRRCQRTGQTESREPSGTGLQGVRVCPGSVREGAACPGGDPTRRGSEAAARRPGHRTTALSSVLSTNAICSPARAAASRRSESPSLRRLPAYPAHGDSLGATGFSGGVSVSWGCRDKVPFSPRPGGWKSEAQASVTRVGSSRGLRPWLGDGCLHPASVPCMCVLNPRFW